MNNSRKRRTARKNEKTVHYRKVLIVYKATEIEAVPAMGKKKEVKEEGRKTQNIDKRNHHSKNKKTYMNQYTT